MSQDLVLQVRDLNVWYRPSGTIGRRKRRQVLHDVSFDLHRGEILGLVGESGSGKTMTCRAILGILSRRAFQIQGKICFDGTDLLAFKRKTAAAFTAARLPSSPKIP